MASIDTSRPVVGLSANASSVFVRAFGALGAWNDARVTRSTLSKLSARELDDIGLSYGDIEDVVARGRK